MGITGTVDDLLVVGQCIQIIAGELQLLAVFSRYEADLFGGQHSREFQRRLPLKEIPSHLIGERGGRVSTGIIVKLCLYYQYNYYNYYHLQYYLQYHHHHYNYNDYYSIHLGSMAKRDNHKLVSQRSRVRLQVVIFLLCLSRT